MTPAFAALLFASTLRIVLPNVPADREAVVTVDGVALTAAEIGEPYRVHAGEHTITARVGEGSPAKVTVKVEEDEAKNIALMPEVIGLKPITKPPPPPPSTSPLVYFGFAAGVIGIVTGSVTGVLALSRASTDECIDVRCSPAGIQDIEAGRTFATASTLSFALGLVALVIGYANLPSSRGVLISPTVGRR